MGSQAVFPQFQHHRWHFLKDVALLLYNIIESCFAQNSSNPNYHDYYGKRQGALKSDSEWRTARRMGFTIQCSPLVVPFAAHRAIGHAVSYSFANQCLPCHSPLTPPFAAPVATPFPINFFQGSLFNVSHSPLTSPFAVAFQLPLSLSIWLYMLKYFKVFGKSIKCKLYL